MKLTSNRLARGACVAALYVAVCFFFKPLSYGPVQFRLSEALCILPVFMPEAVLGLFVGCLSANLLGGSSVALLDMILGSLTTLVAAALTRIVYTKTKNSFLAFLPPVILNALIVGTYVPFIYTSPGTPATPVLIISSIITVGLGQAVVIYLLGYAFFKALDKTKFFKR